MSRAFVTQANVVSHEGRTEFHLRLQPPQLGSVQIHLTAIHEKVSAHVVVAQEDTRQLIAGQAHQLRQSLAESGLVLGNFNVTRDGGGSSQSSYHQQQEGGKWRVEGGGKRQPTTLHSPPSTRVTGGIDILA